MAYHINANKVQLMPLSLDDVIRENRNEIQLRLANVKEIDTVAKKIDLPFHVKDEMDDWRLISLINKINGTTNILLAGDSKTEHQPCITSPIVAIDFEQGIAFTQNHSVYKLGNRGLGEPPKFNLLCIGAAIHAWGNIPEPSIPHCIH